MGEMNKIPEAEVPAKAKRRRFTAAYKLKILEAADAAAPGELGALLRREGLYSSHLSAWRQARREGALGALSKKRGRKRKRTAAQVRMAKLEAENRRLQERLRQAEMVIDVQKKVSQLLGVALPSDERDGRDS